MNKIGRTVQRIDNPPQGCIFRRFDRALLGNITRFGGQLPEARNDHHLGLFIHIRDHILRPFELDIGKCERLPLPGNVLSGLADNLAYRHAKRFIIHFPGIV